MKTSKTIGWTGGTFDLFHAGHVNFLRACAAYCDTLIVALNTDSFTARYKRAPILNLAERMAVVRACKYVDGVVVNMGEEDSTTCILNSGADIIFHADDWVGSSLLQQLGIADEAWLDKYGIEMIYVPYSKGISTTQIIQRCYADYEGVSVESL